MSVDISMRYKDNKDNKIKRIMAVIIIILVIASYILRYHAIIQPKRRAKENSYVKMYMRVNMYLPLTLAFA